MSVMNFQKTFRDVKPPEKGSFPLDHEAECKDIMTRYMKCLRANSSQNSLCRQQSMDYLKCRMDRNLMAKEDWKKLGYADLAEKKDIEKGSLDHNEKQIGYNNKI